METEFAKREIQRLRNVSQRFFHDMLDETKKPHCPDTFKSWIRAICIRAEEEGIYDPRHGRPSEEPLPLQVPK